ncbi:MAG: hypothetical protein AB1450_08315 [Pseudomonadota bacterium]
MRIILAAILACAATAQAADTPRGLLFSYECKYVDTQVAGFSCHADKKPIRIQWHEELNKMTESQRERAVYEFTKLAMRYFELGGTTLEVRADHWPDNKRRFCTVARGRPYYAYGCRDCTVKPMNEGTVCN